LAGCGERAVTEDEFRTRVITLPNGARIRAEVAVHPTEMMRGMMFRESLARDRGMLFIHAEEAEYTYWMFQVKIPLDIIWMDRNHRIVEISASTPPCPSSKAPECPSFGGKKKSQFVLELAGGEAAKQGLKPGDMLAF
jgi:uncharacterized membrane protein (UPF0127 family)